MHHGQWQPMERRQISDTHRRQPSCSGFGNKMDVGGEKGLRLTLTFRASRHLPACLFLLAFTAPLATSTEAQPPRQVQPDQVSSCPSFIQLSPSWKPCLPQAALTESSRLKEQLTMLQLKKDLLGSIFGQERATALLEEVATSVRDRDLLHNRLLQRKSKLQVSPILALRSALLQAQPCILTPALPLTTAWSWAYPLFHTTSEPSSISSG